MQDINTQEKTQTKKREEGVKHIKRTGKVVAFLAIFLIIFCQAEKILAFKRDGYEPNNYYAFESLYEMPKNSLDVVYIGTSQYHLGISPLDIWKQYGITGAVFSASNNRAWLAYYMLEEVLKYQSPNVVVLDAAVPRGDVVNWIGSRQIIGQFRFSSTKIRALYDCMSLEGKSIDYMLNTAVEFFAYHDKWDQLKKEDFADDRSSLSYQKGYLLTTQCVSYSDMNHETNRQATVEEISERTQEYMEKIKKLCDEKGIELMLAKFPSDMWNSTYAGMIGGWAEENKVSYLDMTQEDILTEMEFDEEISYFDSNHLNYIGAESVSKYLGQYLTENYQFDEHSQKISESWEKDYAEYQNYRDLRIMQSTKDLTEFAVLVKNPDYIICISIKDDATRGLTDEEIEKLQSLGVKTRFAELYRGSLVAVIDSGELIEQKDGIMNLSYEYKPYSNCEIKISSAGYEVGNISSIIINGQEYSKNQRGLNVVVYDKTKDKVICSTVFDTWLAEDER